MRETIKKLNYLQNETGVLTERRIKCIITQNIVYIIPISILCLKEMLI
jgi:hypothetical protein